MAGDARGDFSEIVATWGPAILAVIFIRLFIFEPFRIPSGSMVPTLLIGDHVLVTKFSYGVWMPFKSIGIPFTGYGLHWENVELVDLGDPERGDVIVFHYPRQEDITYIKRVVGLPGDTIRVIDNQIVLNGVKQPRALQGPYDDIEQSCGIRKARSYIESLTQSDGAVLDHDILTRQGIGGLLSNSREVTVPPESVFVMGDNRDQSQDSRSWGFVRHDQIKGKAHFVWLSWNGCDGQVGNVRFDRFFRSLYGPAGT